MPSLFARAAAEVLGTFLLVFFGCGAVHVAVLTGDLSGLGQVGLVWGVAIMLAIYCIGGISGSHINPAITIAFAYWGRFAWRDVPTYVAGQLIGAFLAAAMLFVLFGPLLEAKERAKGVERGTPGSVVTAMCYGEYYPNPGALAADKGPYDPAAHAKHNELVSHAAALAAEILGTFILALVVFALTDERNPVTPAAKLAPVFIGLTVTILIMVIAPLTQACFNPARDFGPRLFAFLAGWREAAIPGPNGIGFFTVYILAPIGGAVAGGGVYTHLLRSCLPIPKDDGNPK
jgi:glycerol uptake facilitator protein